MILYLHQVELDFHSVKLLLLYKMMVLNDTKDLLYCNYLV